MFPSLRDNLFRFIQHTFKSKCSSSFLTALEGFDPKISVEEAFTPPNSWYSSQEFHEKEIEKVWKKNWMCVDNFFNFKEPGDYKTGKVANQPYIIMQPNNAIKTFYNVCIHHGSVIENKEENVNTYNAHIMVGLIIDGQVIKCASMKGIKNFKLKENKLKEINSFNYGPMFSEFLPKIKC